MATSTDEQYDAVVVGARCAGATGGHPAGPGRSAGPARRPGRVPERHRLHPPAVPRLAGPARPAGRRRPAPRRAPASAGPVQLAGVRVRGGRWLHAGRRRTTAPSPSGGSRSTPRWSRPRPASRRRDAVRDEAWPGSSGPAPHDDPVRGVVLAPGSASSPLGHRRRRPPLDGRPTAGAAGDPGAARRDVDAVRLLGGAARTRTGARSTSTSSGADVGAVRGRRPPAVVAGPPELTRGSAAERQQAYLAALRRFPAVLNPRLLEQGRQVSPLVVVPETMMRGFARPATGPGWALVGDAGLFKHPVTAQGIGDALAQGWYVGSALPRAMTWAGTRLARRTGPRTTTSGRSTRPGSRRQGRCALYSGLAADPVAGQEFLDIFTRRHRPSEVLTPDRTARWRAAWAYEQGLARARGAPRRSWTTRRWRRRCRPARSGASGPGRPSRRRRRGRRARRVLPRCPRGLARPGRRRGAGSLDAAPRRPARRPVPRRSCCGGFDAHGGRLVTALLRRDRPVAAAPPGWSTAPVGDLAVHLADLREALGVPPDDESAVARLGFAAYRDVAAPASGRRAAAGARGSATVSQVAGRPGDPVGSSPPRGTSCSA